jgi:hypothetical protein
MHSSGNIILINPANLSPATLSKEKSCATSAMTVLLNFLKHQKVSRPYKFTSSAANGGLIENLSLKDNLRLENLDLKQDSQNYMTLLSGLKNMYLNELFKKIGPLDVLPEQSDPQSRKLTSIIKCFLGKADFLFFEYPEQCLDHQNLVILAKAMVSFTQQKSKCCLVFSDKAAFWSTYASQEFLHHKEHGLQLMTVEKKELVREITINELHGVNKSA